MTSTTAAPSAAAASSPPPLTGASLYLTAFVLAMANMIVVLDTTIANVSVPSIAGGLGVSPAQGAWVITSYAVAEAITVPLTGWLAGRFGVVKTFLGAMTAFGVFSACCGAAPTFGMLVFFRVLQGLAGGPMIPLSQTLLQRIFPPHQRGMALGLWAMTSIVGPIAGPILGGYLCDNVGWPSIFYVNVPIAILVTFVLSTRLGAYETSPRRLPIDVIGLVLLVIWVGSLQIMFDKGNELDWFDSTFIRSLAVIAAVGFVVFIIWELTDPHPIVDLRVFRSSTFAIGSVVLAVSFGAFFAQIVILPLWLQTSLGYTAGWAGYAVAPQGLFALVMAPIVGAILLPRIDARALASIGLTILFSVGIMRAFFTTDVDFWTIVRPQLIAGFGIPLFFVTLTSLTISQLTPEEMPGGAGVMNFMRTTAGAFGASMATTAWSNGAQSARAALAHNISNDNSAVNETLAALERAGQTSAQALATVDQMLQQQAVLLATTNVYLVSSLVFLVGAGAIWLTRKPRAVPGPGSAGH